MKYDEFVKKLEKEKSIIASGKENKEKDVELTSNKEMDSDANLEIQADLLPQKEIMPAISTTNAVATNTVEPAFPISTSSQTYGQFENLVMLQNNLNNCLKIIDDEVMKGYLTKLAELPIIEAEPDMLNSLKPIHFFKITELVYQDGEFSVHKLVTIFSSLCNKSCTLVLWVKSDGLTNEFYLGVRSMSPGSSSGTMKEMLKKSFLGMFPGSRVDDYFEDELQADMNALDIGCLSGVTCVADFRQKADHLDDRKFIQGLEKFISSMSGRSYQAMFIAQNVSYDQIMDIKREYEGIATQISPFVNMQINFSMSNSNSTSTGQSDGHTKSTSHGTTKTISTNETESIGRTTGKNESSSHADTEGRTEGTAVGDTETTGASVGTSKSKSESRTESFSTTGGIPYVGSFTSQSSQGTSQSVSQSQTMSKSNSISRTLSHGITELHTDSISQGTSESDSRTLSKGESMAEGENYGVGEAFNFISSKTLTDTLGSTQGISMGVRNMTLRSIMDRLEKQLQRVEECESLGMWDFAAYFIGESAAETESAANIYQSIVSGSKSGIECSAVNTWYEDDKLDLLMPYIKNFLHPHFRYQGFDYDMERYVDVTPAVLVSTNELSIHMGLPYRSVKGLPVVQHAAFAQEVLKKSHNDRDFNFGNIYHLGRESKTPVKLDLDSLTMHTFVTGSTGAGKSNAVYHLIEEMARYHVPFLVVEPAKGEYRRVFPDVCCFGTNPKLGEILRINPFSFPEEIHVLEHIDRLVEIFNVCWPMYAAMPAVLKDSIERAYMAAGWDMDISENTKVPGLFPTFDDVLSELNAAISESDYSADTKGDYIGALSTRLKSLTNGINGRIFTGTETEPARLFNQSAIIDISRVGSMETKALIMGLVVLKLQEFRMSNCTEMNAKLRHVTILEEAHNLLKKTSTEQSAESSNMQGKSVEMLTNMIAEIRTYGEGFVIVDQAPDLLDTAAIRNTNTKIVFRLPEGNDRKITGTSMALSEKQTAELSKLPTGVAAVYQNDWQEAVLCKLPRFASQNTAPALVCKDAVSQKECNDYLLHQLLKDSHTKEEVDKLKTEILSANVSAKIRKDLIWNLTDRNLLFEWAIADFIFKNYTLSDVFRGTGEGKWETLAELSDIIAGNIREEFSAFSDAEIHKIMYCICRIEHERYPENSVIEQLRVEHLARWWYNNAQVQ